MCGKYVFFLGVKDSGNIFISDDILTKFRFSFLSSVLFQGLHSHCDPNLFDRSIRFCQTKCFSQSRFDRFGMVWYGARKCLNMHLCIYAVEVTRVYMVYFEQEKTRIVCTRR